MPTQLLLVLPVQVFVVIVIDTASDTSDKYYRYSVIYEYNIV